MNRVIENVLHLQRRGQMSPLRLDLKSLEMFHGKAPTPHIRDLGPYRSGQPGKSTVSRLDFKARQESDSFCMTLAHGRNPG